MKTETLFRELRESQFNPTFFQWELIYSPIKIISWIILIAEKIWEAVMGDLRGVS